MPLTTELKISVKADRKKTAKNKPGVRETPGYFYVLKRPSDATVAQADYERAVRVTCSAVERGDVVISLPALQLIQGEVSDYRSRSVHGKGPKVVSRLHSDDEKQVDVYAVALRPKGGEHSFLWCRRSNRIISYICRGRYQP
jgi:hypothetical protein